MAHNNSQYIWRYLMYFTVAYLPLFVILLIQAIAVIVTNLCDNSGIDNIIVPSIVGGFIILWSVLFCVGFCIAFSKVQKRNKISYVISEKKNITGQSLTYVIPYIIGIVGISFSPVIIISLLLVLVVIFCIYINSDLLSINPTLSLFGYKSFNVKTEDNSNIFIITKKKDIPNKRHELYLLTDKIYILKSE